MKAMLYMELICRTPCPKKTVRSNYWYIVMEKCMHFRENTPESSLVLGENLGSVSCMCPQWFMHFT